MPDLLDQVRRTIERDHLLSRGEWVVVGVSGGPDSLCLLHLLCRLRADYGLHLHVAHLHHGLRDADADADAEFVQALAADWQLPCTIECADVPALAREHRLAVEEAARHARYAFLARVAGQTGAQAIAVGHNADDQAETVLMHCLRGSGLAGLRGMLPLTSLPDYRLFDSEPRSIQSLQGPSYSTERSDAALAMAKHPDSEASRPKGVDRREWTKQPTNWQDGIASAHLMLIRPLLGVTRAEIETYCTLHDLEPRFDRSNLDTTYFRNWLRHDVLPLLARHNPSIRSVLCRSARVIADDYALLRSLLDETWPRVVIEDKAGVMAFDLAAWRGLPVGLQRSTLREAIHRLRRSLRNINYVHIENALAVARDGTTGDQATLPAGLMLTLGYDRFRIAGGEVAEPLPAWPLLPPGDALLPLAVPGVTLLPGSDWAVEAVVLSRADLVSDWEANPDPWQAFLDHQALGAGLVLRTRRPGDRFQPLGLGGRTAKLADFLTNQKVPHAARDRLPLLTCDLGIAWVCGQRVDERARLRETTDHVLYLRFVKS